MASSATASAAARPGTAADCERAAAGSGRAPFPPAAGRRLPQEPQRRLPAARCRGGAARRDAGAVARDWRGVAAVAGSDRRLARRARRTDRGRGARPLPGDQCQRGAVALPLGARTGDRPAHHPARAERLSDDRLCRERACGGGMAGALPARRCRCARRRDLGRRARRGRRAGDRDARQLEQRRADRHCSNSSRREGRGRALHRRLRAIGWRGAGDTGAMGRRRGARDQRQMVVRRPRRGMALGRPARPHRALARGARLVESRQSVRDGYQGFPLRPRRAPLVGRHARRCALRPVDGRDRRDRGGGYRCGSRA